VRGRQCAWVRALTRRVARVGVVFPNSIPETEEWGRVEEKAKEKNMYTV
jgi:hypothetical protein